MEREKIALGALVIIIVAVLSFYLLSSEGLLDDLFSETETIEMGDCADVTYVLRYASNDTIIQENSEDDPLQVFISKDQEVAPPSGYSNYSSNLIEGFMNEMIGLKEGQDRSFTLSPEEAYGREPKVNDEIVFSSPGSENQTLIITQIKENAQMPSEYVSDLGDVSTTIFALRTDISLGQEMTVYPTWINASVVTKVNETKAYVYTTPPEDKMNNFTWINSTLGYNYWTNSTSVIDMNDSTITLEHTPEVNDTMVKPDSTGYSTITYTVENVGPNQINCSYTNSEDNTSYIMFDKTMEIKRNQSQSLITELPIELLQQIIQFYPIYYGVDIIVPFSLSPLAGESLYYEVTVLNVYKTSEES